MDEAKQQLVDKLKTANNILVTVSRDPSVDQLSSLLGLTLFLNKQGKHAAAVFSGEVPSTLEFLQPEETIEKNTDSLRDFIIALDKSKADKLRYKVEDNVVRIFITPYKTSISQEDFDFSQGDFNVDLVLALGVKQQEDLDEAITAHGRILHDATVASVNIGADGGLGSINWHVPEASSLSELVTRLTHELDSKLLDEQIATALLTGIVAETDRFSNDKTSAQTMSASAELMAAGANQQLVASKLDETDTDQAASASESDGESPEANHDGAIEISHDQSDTEDSGIELPEPDDSSAEAASDLEPDHEVEVPADTDVEVDKPASENQPASDEQISSVSPGSKLITEAPTMGGVLTANSTEEKLDPVTDPLSLPKEENPQLLDHNSGASSPFTPPPPAWVPPNLDSAPETPEPQEPEKPTQPAQPQQPEHLSFNPTLTDDPSAGVVPATTPQDADGTNDDSKPDDNSSQTLTDLEKSVESPHVDSGEVGAARDEVNKALNGADAPPSQMPDPISALNAQPLGNDLHSNAPQTAPSPQVNDPTAPPPVPPPIPFQFGNPPSSQ